MWWLHNITNALNVTELYALKLWRRKWQATPVLLPGESQGQGNLVGCSPWGPKESDTTELLTFSLSHE